MCLASLYFRGAPADFLVSKTIYCSGFQKATSRGAVHASSGILSKRDIWKFATKQLWMQSAGWGPQVFLLVAQGKCGTCTSGSEGKKQVLCRKYWSEQSTLPCSFGEHEIEWDEVEHHRCLCKIPRAGMDARLNWKVLGGQGLGVSELFLLTSLMLCHKSVLFSNAAS